jgi:hypothetical protein
LTAIPLRETIVVVQAPIASTVVHPKALRRLLVLVFVCLSVAFATAAPAAAYWDFQGNLAGGKFYLKYNNVGPGYQQPVRMSWTFGSHCMRFLRINSGGSWYEPTVCGYDGACIYGAYDCFHSFPIYSIYDRTGCYNPPNLSTVWVNCRATFPIQ